MDPVTAGVRCLGCADSILGLPHQCGGMIHPGCRTDLPAVLCCCEVCHPPGGPAAVVAADARRRRPQRHRR